MRHSVLLATYQQRLSFQADAGRTPKFPDKDETIMKTDFIPSRCSVKGFRAYSRFLTHAWLISMWAIGLAATPAMAATWTVNSTGDTTSAAASNCNASTLVCPTLRDAVAAANADSGDTIVFDASLYNQTITLNAFPALADISKNNLDITSNMTITGPGASKLTISGGGYSRLFIVETGITVSISGVTITGGARKANGGAIYNSGTLIVTDSTFSNNTATTQGGAIFSARLTATATVTVTNSVFSGNSAITSVASGGWGGAIFGTGTQITVNGCTFINNSANGSTEGGGAINNYSSSSYTGVLTVNNSTFFNNTATYLGGAIYSHNYSTINVTDSTLTGNSAVDGGAIYVNTSSQLTVTNSTITANSATDTGGGIYNYSSANIANSIVSNNTGSSGYDNIHANYAPNNDLGGNALDGDTSIQLAALGNYGGSTKTMPPLPGSPALCAGKFALTTTSGNTRLTADLTTDQRGTGYARTNATYTGFSSASPCVDAGAVQTHYDALSFTTQPADVVFNSTMSPSPEVTLTESGSPATFATSGTVTVIDADNSLSSGATKTATLSSGTATFGNLNFGTIVSSDSLTASLQLNAASPAITLTAASNTFDINGYATTITAKDASATYSTGAQIVTLPATVSSSGSTVNAGTVTFTVYGHGLAVGAATTSSTIANGSASVNYTLPAGTSAGEYMIAADYNADGAFASSSDGTHVLTVAQAAPTISISNIPSSATYGGNFTPLFTYTGDGAASVVSGTAGICTVTSGVVSYIGAGTCTLTAKATAGTNYAAITGTPQSFIVAQATPTISISNIPSNAIYGSSFTPSFTYSGDGAASVASGTAGICTVASGVVSYIGVGACSLTPSAAAGTNYEAVTGMPQSFSVVQATPTITWVTPSAITYGTALSTTQLNATANTTGSFVYIPSEGTIPGVGTNTLQVTFTPTDATNYSSVSKTVSLTVNAVTTTPVPTIGSLSPAYASAGGAAFALTIAGSNFTSGSTVYWGSTALTTTYVSATQLTAAVTAAQIASAGTTAIFVQTAGGSPSNTLLFETDSSTSFAPTFTTATVTVTAGSAATYAVTIPSSVASSSAICLNLPAGASCSYSSVTKTVTVTTSTATPAGSYLITVVFTEALTTTTTAGILLPILLLPLLLMRRKLAVRGAWFTACLAVILLAGSLFAVGCGGGTQSTSTTTTTQVTSSGVVTLIVK